MKTLFAIGPDDQNHDETLLVELGQDHFSYAFMNRDTKKISMIRYLSFNELEGTEELEKLITGLKEKANGRVIFGSAYSQALLVPQKYSDRKLLLFETFYDLPAQMHYSDTITEWQIVTVYALPETINNVLVQAFPHMQVYHAYTSSIKNQGVEITNQIYIQFTTNYFRVIVKKDQQVLLAQTYAYKNPLDVVYYLLKIVYEFAMDQSKAVLVISGLIEENSSMYQELRNYFLNVQFPEDSGFELPENEYPSYYFTSLYNLAECAS